jgi:homoserine kinase
VIRVRVPATTANLGPGFDCLALALDLWNESEFEIDARSGGPGRVLVEGEGKGRLRAGPHNLLLKAALRLFAEVGQAAPGGLVVRCCNQVPMSSGLGSSATAIVAGLAGANALLGSPFDRQRLLELAAEMEGHPDNAAAAVLGGLVVGAQDEPGGLVTRQVETPAWTAAVVVPDFRLSTHAARAALPEQISMQDAVFNLGRAALVVEALRSGDPALLGQAMQDRLHQPYRLKLVPGAEAALAAARQAGAAAAVLSGAGPGLIAFGVGDLTPAAAAMQAAFQAAGLSSRSWLLTTTPLGVQVEY